jgi:glutaredoxin
MKASTIALAAALLAVSAAQAQTSVYRWVDKDGKVQFSDAPPPADAKDVKQKQMGGGSADDSNQPYATQIAMRRNPVTFYTGNACGDLCNSARNLLLNRGIPFAEKNAESNPADGEALKKLTGELRVPVLVIGQETLKGYDSDTWHSALDTAGYPRTRLPSQPVARTVSPPAPPTPPAPARQAQDPNAPPRPDAPDGAPDSGNK